MPVDSVFLWTISKFHYPAMDCIEILSNYFKFLSSKSFLKLEIIFDPSEKTNISSVDQEILENIKNCLIKSYFFQTEVNFPKDGKYYQVEKSNHIESENVCKICKKKFSHKDILNFHQKSVHHEESSQSSENFILEKNPTGNQKVISENNLDFFCCIGCNMCFKSKTTFDTPQYLIWQLNIFTKIPFIFSPIKSYLMFALVVFCSNFERKVKKIKKIIPTLFTNFLTNVSLSYCLLI